MSTKESLRMTNAVVMVLFLHPLLPPFCFENSYYITCNSMVEAEMIRNEMH